PRPPPSFPTRRSSDLRLAFLFILVIDEARSNAVDADVAAGHGHFRDRGEREGDHHRTAAGQVRLEDVAAAKVLDRDDLADLRPGDRKSTRLNSSHVKI